MPEPPAADAYVTVAEAARHLGVTTQAVRNRIRRGQLVGEMRGDRWYVLLPGQAQTTGATMAQPDQHIADTTAAAPDDLAERVRILEGQVAYLRTAVAVFQQQLTGSVAEPSEVAWLREQLRIVTMALIEHHGQ